MHIVRSIEMRSQVTWMEASHYTQFATSHSRRDWLTRTIRFLGAAGMGTASLATIGCISSLQAGKVDLVWGRRGLSDGRFIKPRAVAIDEQDQLYIVDTTGRIQVFNGEGEFLRSWSTPEITNGKPTGLAIAKSADRVPRLLVADTHYYRMLVYSLEGQPIASAQIGGTAGHQPGEFAFVTDAVMDERGNYYIGEYNASDRIQKFASDGTFLTQWGGNGTAPGKFVRPQSLVIDGDVLWVCDSCNHRIQRFDIRPSTPELIDIWGSPGTGPGEFYYPYDLAIASDGSVVVVEHKNNRLQRFDSDGQWIASWGGPGFEPGELNGPWGLVIDSNDLVYVLDSSNHRVQRIGLPA